jgi:tetratricopeptide (TPR) repeat protein
MLQRELRRASVGEMRCLLLTGDPGLGKSRLAGELLDRNKWLARGLVARAHPLGATDSFGVLAEALEHGLQGMEAEAIRRLCGGVMEDLARLLPAVAAVRAAPLAHQMSRLRLLQALMTIFRNLAADRPVALVIDDIHVADPSSLDAVSYLARNLQGSRVLLLLTARPAELASNSVAQETVLSLEQDGLLERFVLQPLDRDQVKELANAVLDRPVAPASLVDWLFERSLGNPLFAIGLLRSLVEQGGDLQRPQLSQVPDGLEERVRLRLRTVSAPSLSVLELLAVLGQRVVLDDLIRVSGRPVQALASAIDELVSQRFVIEGEQGAKLSYEIVHPLIQEVIYQTIVGARRQAVHSQIARALLAGGRPAAAAPHFVQSAQPGDQEAITAVLDAFRRAEERESHREAMALLEALLVLVPPADPRWLDVLDVMTEDAEWVVDHKGDAYADVGAQAMTHIEQLLEGVHDPVRSGLVKLRLMNFQAFGGAGDLVDAERNVREALELFKRANQPSRAMMAVNELGWVLGLNGDLITEESYAREALEAAQTAGDQVLVMQALSSLSWVAINRGRFPEGEGLLRRCAALARSEGKLYRLTWSLSVLAFVRSLQGNVGEARAIIEEARAGNPAYADTLLVELSSWIEWMAGAFEPSIRCWLESEVWNRGALPWSERTKARTERDQVRR